jgi:type IV secretory pathway TrbL component
MLDDGLRDKIGTAKAIEFIREDPARVPILALLRLGHFFELERRALTFFYSNNFFGYIATPWLIMFSAILLIPFVFLSTSSMYGLILSDWRRQEVIWMGLVLVTYIVPHVLLLAEDRFHLTVIPFIAILAARCWEGGVRELRQMFYTSSKGRWLVIIASVAVLLLFFNWGRELALDYDKLILLFSSVGNTTGFPY